MKPTNRYRFHPIILLLLISVLTGSLAGCGSSLGSTGQAAGQEESPPAKSIRASMEPERILTATTSPSPTPPTPTAEELTFSTAAPTSPATSPPATAEPTTLPGNWTELPVVPVIDEGMQAHLREIYARGLELGNNPQAFSKVGDCGSTPAWFLGDFDRGPRYYSLGEYAGLEGVIQVFQGSFERTSLAAKAGFTTASVLAPLWADRKQCESNESPLACEYRLHRPSIALITLGTNDIWHEGDFEPQLRTIIETSLDQGVIPVLSTKADNLEEDGSINATIVRLAQEYNLPVWNYWRAVQPLPDQGLQEDGAHITWGPNRFDDPKAMEKGWPWRNLTALQVLDAVWLSLTP